jgi:hypothetical protein
MIIEKTTIDRIKNYRTDYLNSLPEFQELFIEILVNSSDYYLLKSDNKEIGYAIVDMEGILIEYYLINRFINEGKEFFRQVKKDLSVTKVYCKSFDSILLSNCLLCSFPYSVLGLLYRDYDEPAIEKDPEINMERVGLSSVGLIQRQDDSIKVLFDTEQQLVEFITNENVFTFNKNDELIGCGMVIRTHLDWDYCDLGVWVHPSKRGNSYGSQILLCLREFAINNNMNPSCGCAIENTASKKAIEKSGFVSKYELINFKTK